MIRGVFFDLYGTLLPYGNMDAAWAAWLNALHGVLVDVGLQQNVQAFGVCCEGFFGRPEPAELNGLTLYEARIAEFCRELRLEPDDETMRRAAAASVRAWQRYVPLDPDAHDVLAELRGRKKLALISNFDHPPHVHDLLREHKLAEYFEHIIVSAEVGLKKPDPRIFEPALAAAEIEPAEVIYVGDTLDDVNGAKAAGMVPVLIRRDGQGDGSAALDYKKSANVEGEEELGGVRVIRALSELLEAAIA